MRCRPRRALPLALLSVLAACGHTGAEADAGAGAAGETTPPTETVVLALGGTGTAGGLRIRPVSLLEDSRCPAAVMCVQAGTVRIRARVSGGGPGRMLVLKLQDALPVAGRCVGLEKVDPYPVQPGSITPGEYRFTISVRPVGDGCGLTETSR